MKKIFGNKYEVFSCFLLVLVLLFSIYTYFTSLSQYATGDQQGAYGRLQRFLANPDSVNLYQGYGFENIVVALPGKIVEQALDKKYVINDLITGNIHYTQYFPYTLVQVCVSLMLLFYLVFLLFKLTGIKLMGNLSLYLVMLLVIINYPMLKGIVKVLKYDALSQITSIISILHYILYRKTNKLFNIIGTAVFIALAFIQKNTAFSVILLMIVFEIISLMLQPGNGKDFLKSIIRFLIIYSIVFFVTCYLFLPKIWFNLSEFSSILGETEEYMKAFNGTSLFILAVVFGLLFIIARKFVNKKNIPLKSIVSKKQQSKKNSPFVKTQSDRPLISQQNLVTSYYILFALVSIVFMSAILYQKNNIVCITTADETMLQKIKLNNYFVTPEIFGWNYTTMDKSRWVTTIKILYNHLRIFIYTTPIISNIALCVSFLLIGLGIKRQLFKEDLPVIFILFGFAMATLFAYSLLFALPEPRYNLLPDILFVMFGIYVVITYVGNLFNTKWKSIILLTVIIGIIRPLAIANPTYIGYMNLLRNSEYENNDFLDYNKYCNWTYVGWGEASYGCYQFIEKKYPGKQKVMFSYLEPFYINSNIESIEHPSFDHRKPYDNTMFRTFLQYLVDNNFSVLIVNKSRAYRDAMANLAVKTYRDRAVYIDKIGTIEYAWAFDVKDLLKIAGGPTADYYVNISSEKFKEGKYEEVIEYCKKGIEIEPNHFNAHINITVAYINLNKINEALKAAQKAVEIDPASELAKNNLNYINNF